MLDNNRPTFQGAAWYLVKFLAVMAGLEYGYELARGTWINRLVVDRCTVVPAAKLIGGVFRAFGAAGPGAHVVTDGHRLVFEGTVVDVNAGCEGIEGMFLLLAAVLAFRAPLKSKVIGAVTGVVLMYVLNQCRLLILFSAIRWHQGWFEPLHGIFLPSAIVLAGGIFFFLWTDALAPGGFRGPTNAHP